VDVGAPDRAGRGDLRVGQQRVLDDGGVDVVPAADDEVLGPAGEVDEAVRVDAGEVAGVQPAVAQLAESVEDVAVRGAADDVAGKTVGPLIASSPVSPAGTSSHAPSAATRTTRIRW
jgi:hypothetical protein